MKDKIKKIVIIVSFLAIIFSFGFISAKDMLENCDFDATPSVLESNFKDNIFLKTKMIEAHGFTQRLILNSVVEDAELGGVVKTKWGQLTSLPTKTELPEFEAKLNEITDACEKNNIAELYIQAPFKILPKYEAEELGIGLSTTANSNADNIISKLKARDVDVLDLREVLSNSELDKKKLFFNTDHHWTVETAFYAFGKTAEYLNLCDKETREHITDINNYNKKTMENCYLGSWGRRTGTLFCGLDDFSYLVPKFDTEINIKRIAGENIFENTSDFYNTLMNPKRVEKEKYGHSEEEIAAGFGDGNIYTDLYSVYLDGYVSEIRSINNKINSDKRILIFQDSFGFPFSPFMCLAVKEARIIDLRNWDEDIMEYITDYNPDEVIIIYNPDQ